DTPSGHRRLTKIPAGRTSGSAKEVRAEASRFLIRSDARSPRPIQAPPAAATTAQAMRNTIVTGSSFEAAAAIVTAPRAVASPAVRSTVALRKSVNGIRRGCGGQQLEQFDAACRPVDQDVRLGGQSVRRLRGADADADRLAEEVAVL